MPMQFAYYTLQMNAMFRFLSASRPYNMWAYVNGTFRTLTEVSGLQRLYWMKRTMLRYTRMGLHVYRIVAC